MTVSILFSSNFLAVPRARVVERVQSHCVHRSDVLDYMSSDCRLILIFDCGFDQAAAVSPTRRLMPITWTMKSRRRRSGEVREYLRGGEEIRSCCDHVVELVH